MPIAPAVLVLRGLRADAAGLVADLATDEVPRARLCQAAAELAELVVAHVRSAEVHALPTLTADAATRAAAQLHELRGAADAVGDALALLLSAGLDDAARDDARRALARRVAALAGALPQEVERHGDGWDTAALRCRAALGWDQG